MYDLNKYSFDDEYEEELNTREKKYLRKQEIIHKSAKNSDYNYKKVIKGSRRIRTDNYEY